jgi:glyoxylase-like metal-dependent hydrolase (beta-lactamase superfamily II)
MSRLALASALQQWPMDYRIISIGALSAHPLWNEKPVAGGAGAAGSSGGVRTGHTTTTLITSGDRRILVDPGLPGQMLAARLGERANLKPSDITDVFLTSFHPETHRGLAAFDKARWLISAEERESVGVQLATALKDIYTRSEDQGGVAKDESLLGILRGEVAILQRCEPAPQSLADRVDVFPLPGVSPGLCGLILSGPRFTTVVCGDAMPTQEHLEQGKVLTTAVDIEQARTSFEEIIEIADMVVPGRDNLLINPTKRPF